MPASRRRARASTGRGFAVVAGEVKKLAASSSSSAERVTQVVARVQEEIAGVVALVRGTGERVRGSQETIGTLQSVLDTMATVIARTDDLAGLVEQLSRQQMAAHQEIVRAVEQIASAAEETAAGAEETAAAVEDQVASFGSLQAGRGQPGRPGRAARPGGGGPDGHRSERRMTMPDRAAWWPRRRAAAQASQDDSSKAFLELILAVSQAAAASMDVGQMAQTVHQEIGRLFDRSQLLHRHLRPGAGRVGWKPSRAKRVDDGGARGGRRAAALGPVQGRRRPDRADSAPGEPLLFRTEAELRDFCAREENRTARPARAVMDGSAAGSRGKLVGVMGIQSYEQEGLSR